MPRMRITALGRQRLYLRRDMIAGDGTADLEPSVVDAARELGYAEDITAEPAPQRRRGRPPKAHPPEAAAGSVKADEYAEKTVPELREIAEEQGVDLPSGYVRKDELLDALTEHEPKKDEGDEDA